MRRIRQPSYHIISAKPYCETMELDVHKNDDVEKFDGIEMFNSLLS